MALDFTKPTDEEHEIRLTSRIEVATWRSGCAVPRRWVSLEVLTSFVGECAGLDITVLTEEGAEVGRLSGLINNNRFSGGLRVPQDLGVDDVIYFEVNLPAHGLTAESNHIPVRAMDVIDIQWSEAEARSGDVLTLSATLEGVAHETPAVISIYEHDQNEDHDLLTQIDTLVEQGRIEVRWEYQYHEDLDDIPSQSELETYGGDYNPPEYFFTITIDGIEFGRAEQDSGLLQFKCWIDIRLLDDEGEPVPNVNYTLFLPSGEEREGTLDGNGMAREEDVPPGPCRVEFEPSED